MLTPRPVFQSIMSSTKVPLKDWFQQATLQALPPVLLLDGGVSTYLEALLSKRGEKFAHRRLWSSSLLLTETGQEDIVTGHNAFAQAGADILSTVTYQCHFYEKNMVVERPKMKDMMVRAIQLAQQINVVDKKTGKEEEEEEDKKEEDGQDKKGLYTVVSSGCFGAALADGSEYKGNYGQSQETLENFHREKLDVFLSANPDGIAFETVPDMTEVKAICSLIETMKKNTENTTTNSTCFWLSLGCKDGQHLSDGTPLVDALSAIDELDPRGDNIHAVGINCCDGKLINSLLEITTKHLAQQAQSTTTGDEETVNKRRGIVVYPNSGEEWDAEKACWKEGSGCASSDEFCQLVLKGIDTVEETWNKAFATDGAADEHQQKKKKNEPPPKIVVGGCCRTSPTAISAIRQALDKRFGG